VVGQNASRARLGSSKNWHLPCRWHLDTVDSGHSRTKETVACRPESRVRFPEVRFFVVKGKLEGDIDEAFVRGQNPLSRMRG
jgi:hypothetical protein